MKGRGVRGRISTNSARMDCWSAKHGTQSIETSSEAIAKNASVERITEFSMRGSFKRMVPFYEIILSKANVCCWALFGSRGRDGRCLLIGLKRTSSADQGPTPQLRDGMRQMPFFREGSCETVW